MNRRKACTVCKRTVGAIAFANDSECCVICKKFAAGEIAVEDFSAISGWKVI